MFGVGGRLALGVEIEAEYEDGDLALGTVGAKALYRFTSDEAPVAVGLLLQVGVDSELALAEAEARLIVTLRSQAWWAQGNVMVRRSADAGAATVDLAYAASLQHSLGGFAWLGIEASGQPASVWRDPGARGEDGHFAGPSLTLAWDPSGREIEIGLAYLRRLDGEGPTDSGRLFVQLGF